MCLLCVLCVFKAIQEQMKMHGQEPVCFDDVKNEIFDMVKPADPLRITLQDLVKWQVLLFIVKNINSNIYSNFTVQLIMGYSSLGVLNLNIVVLFTYLFFFKIFIVVISLRFLVKKKLKHM